MKVLIIDDERSIRNTLKEILEFEGHEVATAEEANRAWIRPLPTISTPFSATSRCR